MRNCVEIFHATKVNAYRLDIVSLKFREKETVQYFLNTFYMKTRLSQDLHLDMELLKKMFPKMLNMKNANKVQKKKFFSK